jgi:hypothetical protein
MAVKNARNQMQIEWAMLFFQAVDCPNRLTHMPTKLDPRIKALADKVIADGKNKRAIAVLKALLKKGSITTDDLNELGYNHPPRAVGDVRDAGIPVITSSTISKKSGRRMAIYTFGDPSKIQSGRIGGRSALPKSFKVALIAQYGSADRITGTQLDERVLQIDHRVPYRIAGDAGLRDHDVDAYMLLDASSQRAKSWACEHCPNMLGPRQQATCETCFWAFPEIYLHIATQQIRRTDVVWQGNDVPIHDSLKKEADRRKTTVAEILRELARQKSRKA